MSNKIYKKSCLLIGAALFTFNFSLLTACSDYLDTSSPSKQAPETVYSNTGKTRNAIMGVYADMTNAYVYGQKISINWQSVTDIELASRFVSDPASQITRDEGVSNFWSDWYNTNVKWDKLYAMAGHATDAVYGIRNSKLLSDPEYGPTMRRFLGEAIVLRNLAYLELVSRWGDIPFTKEIANSDLSNVYLGKTSRDVVYAAIVEELQEAVGYLPWQNEDAEYNAERVTKGFAKGLLARACLMAGGWSLRDGNQFPDDSNIEHYPATAATPGMTETNGYYIGRVKDWQRYYEIAEQQCAEIIGSTQNPHHLESDYGNIWKAVCGLGYSLSNENLFEVGMGVGHTGDVGALMGRALDGDIGYGSRGFGGNYVCTNGYYFYSFDPDDTRRDYACYFPRMTQVDGVNKEKMQNNILSVNIGKWDFFWTSETYRALALSSTDRVKTGINWILMRYPDILLMYAEAHYMLGKGEDTMHEAAGITARQALEQVRERAFAGHTTKVKDYDPDFFEAIVNERAWEFGGEGIRKMDLIRWGLLDQKIEAMKTAMCNMIDLQQEVHIFDKVYQPDEFPKKLYFKYNSDGRTIDLQSANFYDASITKNPNANIWSEVNWVGRVSSEADNIEKCTTILECGNGLRSSYDYSAFLGTLQYGSSIGANLDKVKMGNKTCNYRHLLSIYYEDIYESNGLLKNSYGFDYGN